MLRIRKLKFNNIGRFVKEQEFSLDSFGQLIQVNGHNKNTGGSSGAGKSTVFHALDYLLGINDIPVTGLQSRLTKEKIYSEGVFDVNGKELIVKRSKKDGLYIKYGDEEVSGNVKLAEERLDGIIGINRGLFKKMVHKKQKEGGFFLNLTAKQSYDFLMDALGLNGINEKIVKIDNDIKEKLKRIGELGHAITAFENSIDEFEEILDFTKEPENTVNLSEIETKKQKLESIKKQQEQDKNNLQSELDKLPKPVKKEINFEPNPQIAKLEKQIAELKHNKKNKIFQYNRDVSNAQEARTALETKLNGIPFHKQQMDNYIDEMKSQMEQKKHIEDEKCPTCSQKWAGDNAQMKIKLIDHNISDLKVKILEKKKIVDEEGSLKEKIERVKAIQVRIEKEHDLETINGEIFKLNKMIVEFKSIDKNKASELENKYLKEVNELSQKADVIKSKYKENIEKRSLEISSLAQEIAVEESKAENYKQSLSIYKEKKEKLESKIKEKKSDLKDALKQRESKRYELSVCEESKRLLKTYTLQIFQDTLDYIGSYATEILSNIPNMSNSTIYFEGCKENKSGTIKDEVNAIINMDGYNNINIKTLSGGERTVIDLSVDLAVIDMIESKAGKGADFFILDEPFEGLEEINISQCLEVLSQADTNKKIIIVDHNPIAKEMINDTILVERDGEESVVL